MSEKVEVLDDELRVLMNDQKEALRENLTPDEIENYVEREKRIAALLEQMGKGGRKQAQ